MKKKERKDLEVKLLVSIKKAIQDNKADLSTKIEKAVKKSIKKIAKKTAKKKNSFATEKIKKTIKVSNG